MKIHALMFLAFAALASVACSGGDNGATPDVDQDDVHARAAIDAIRTEYVQAWMAADAARVAGLYSEDAIVLYPNHAAIVGRPAIRQLGSVDARNEAMTDLGYEAMGECGIPGRRYFRKNNALGEREFNVHLFAAGSAVIERHLAFRDFLRAREHLAAEYSELKGRLARQHPDSIDLYMGGKDAFVKEMECQAVAWRRSAQLSPAREVTEAFATERSR